MGQQVTGGECVSSRKPHTYQGLLHEAVGQYTTPNGQICHFSILTVGKENAPVGFNTLA